MAIKVEIDRMLADRKWSIKKLAEVSGVTRSNVWKLVRGRTTFVKLATVNAICRALECQPGDFLKYEAQMDLPLQPPEQDVIDSNRAQA